MFVSLVVSPQSLYICIVKINYQNKLLMKRFTITTLLIALYSMMMVAQVTPPSTATSETWSCGVAKGKRQRAKGKCKKKGMVSATPFVL